MKILRDFEEIKTLSNHQFKTFLMTMIEEKLLSIDHKKLSIQEFLQHNNVVNIQSTKFIFPAGTRLIDIKMNCLNKFRKDYLNGPLKCEDKDSQ